MTSASGGRTARRIALDRGVDEHLDVRPQLALLVLHPEADARVRRVEGRQQIGQRRRDSDAQATVTAAAPSQYERNGDGIATRKSKTRSPRCARR